METIESFRIDATPARNGLRMQATGIDNVDARPPTGSLLKDSGG